MDSSQNSDTTGRYSWKRVRSNRHKSNKKRDCSVAHLEGRSSLLNLELEELGDQYPTVSARITAEMELIADELALRAAGKSKPTEPEAPPEAYDWGDTASLDALEHTELREDTSCEN